MKLLQSKKAAKICTAVFSVLFVVLFVGNLVAAQFAISINAYFDTDSFEILRDEGVSEEDRTYFSSAFDSVDAFVAHEAALCQLVEAEGAVLLKNDNGALPFHAGAKVSLFSHSSVDFIYGGTGSGSVDTKTAPDFKTALEASGIAVNEELWKFYSSKEISEKYSRSVTDIDLSATSGEYKINEVPWSELEGAGVTSSFSNYGDAAIFVLSRGGGEGGDLWREGTDGENGDYLSLSAQEKETLEQLCALRDNGTFQSVVLLINSSNAPNMAFMNRYDIDAVLWVGGVGQYGMYAVADILAGAVNPSGKLADTFVYDNHTAPAMANFGHHEYTNYVEMGLTDTNAKKETDVTYVVYQEGIYVGYRYYETRYEDFVMGKAGVGEYDYANTVIYPFGYGLSYTTFEYSGYKMAQTDTTYEITVTVTNTGEHDGKEVVEVYLQKPYTEYDRQNGIEKAAVELVGFAKTGLLSANGGSETVTVSVNKEDLRTYDAYGKGTYILEKGDYFLTVGRDAHDAVNNILAAKGMTVANGMTDAGNGSMTSKIVISDDDFEIYAVSADTGAAIINQLSDIDLKLYEGYSDKADFRYLSRNDWTGTWPETIVITLTKQMAEDIEDAFETKSGYELPLYGQQNGLTMVQMMGKAYDDPDWDKLLDQMTYEEQVRLVCDAFHQTHMVISINKPATKETNGPQGITDSFINGKSGGTAFPAEVVMCATWNTELLRQVGECFGEQGLNSNKDGIYGPAANIHRTAYSGRNYEYYSEDGFLSGAMAAAEVAGIESKGIVVYMKHYALNDQETNRAGVCTFANENSIREIYLKPFEMATRIANVHGYMTVMNRVGTKWGGAHYGLLTAIPRGEWGFEGAIITDCTVNSRYTDSLVGLEGGSDFWDGVAGLEKTDDNLYLYEGDPYVAQLLRQAVHRLLYVQANSTAMNGLSPNDRVVEVMTWWQIALLSVVTIFGILTAVSAAWLVYAMKCDGKKKGEAAHG